MKPRLLAAIAIAALATASCSSSGDDTSPATTETTTAPTAPPFSFGDVLAVADAYFEAYNAGDVGRCNWVVRVRSGLLR